MSFLDDVSEKIYDNLTLEESIIEISKLPSAWEQYSKGLKNAGEFIFFEYEEERKYYRENKKINEDRTYLFTIPSEICRMLFGYSLETLLKGVLLKEKSTVEKVYKNNKITWSNVGINNPHDLIQLCIKGEINLNNEEKILLKAYKESITCAGRYPLTKDFKNIPEYSKILSNDIKDLTELNDIYKAIEEISNKFTGSPLVKNEYERYNYIYLKILKKYNE